MRSAIVKVTLLAAVAVVLGCTPPQPAQVTVKMIWACGFPEHLDSRSDYARQDPNAKPVILYFSRYPNHFIQDNSPGLCDALTVAKRREVPVVIQPLAGYSGYTIITIDGHTPAGGYGGDNGRIGNDPNPSLKELLR